MDRAHASFAALVEARLAEDPAALIYGVTTAPGDGATEVLSEERRARRPTHMWTAASFGEPLPERVTRAIVLARLANLLGGHATIRAEVAAAVTAMLESPLPPVPSQGNGGAGEILALGHLFYAIPERFELAPKERMALVNGSPCAAALVADAALAGARRLALAEQVFALAAAVLGVPLEAYGAELEPLWGDPHETAALRSLRALLESDGGMRQAHQAPVSFRILPRVLGAVRRAQAAAEEAAAISLRSVTDNPVYVPPTDRPPLGAVFSTGGYHDARAPAALDGLAFAWTDLCQLAARATDRLFQHPGTAARARTRRVDGQAAAHGGHGLGGGGARAGPAEPAVARRLRPERHGLSELSRLAQGRRRRALPGRRARGAGRARRPGVARRRRGRAAGTRRARRRGAGRLLAARRPAAAGRRDRAGRRRLHRPRLQPRVASTW